MTTGAAASGTSAAMATATSAGTTASPTSRATARAASPTSRATARAASPAARATAITALGMRGRNIDQAHPQRHRQSRHSHDGQNGNPPLPPNPGFHPILLQNIEFQVGDLIATQAQVAPPLWRQASTLRKERERCLD